MQKHIDLIGFSLRRVPMKIRCFLPEPDYGQHHG